MREKIRLFIVDNFLFGDAKGLEDSTSLLGAGVVDSTGILEMVSFLEQEFAIKIQDEELVPEHLDSINSISLFLQRKLGVAT
ncbi:acyl carrier protein [Geomonas sp. RF6]|uniref:acyl carrier protein n=1 Tax=Geomonas sp. RF6 TaxID=2897342 RepID=UPI001E5E6EC0|nr:acyl carrier protein [Geomonas sp. RF6]UFS69145.1 acyl carrier protein [Geomonas sp. RF6]